MDGIAVEGVVSTTDSGVIKGEMNSTSAAMARRRANPTSMIERVKRGFAVKVVSMIPSVSFEV